MEDTAQTEYGTDTGTDAGQTNHTVRLLRAALPYLNSGLKSPLDLLLKGMEFFEAARGFRMKDTLTAFQYTQPANLIADPDGLIQSVRQVAYPSERRLLDLLAGWNNIRKFYEMYQSLAPFLSDLNPAPFSPEQPADRSEPSKQENPQSFSPDLDSLMKMAEIMRMFSDSGERPADADSLFRVSSLFGAGSPFGTDSPFGAGFGAAGQDSPPSGPPPQETPSKETPSQETPWKEAWPEHYAPDDLPFVIPSDAEACGYRYYDGFDQPEVHPAQDADGPDQNQPGSSSPKDESKKG